MVLQTQIFFWSTTFPEPEKNLVYSINPPFFWFEKSGWPEKKIWVCRTTFLEPFFYTFLEKWLQNKWSIALIISSEKVTRKSSGTHRPYNCVTILTNFKTEMLFTLLLVQMLQELHYLFKAFCSLFLLQKCQNDQS